MSKQIIVVSLTCFIVVIKALHDDLIEVNDWPKKHSAFGQLSAVDFDNNGNVVVFHRGNRIWDANSFSLNEVYRHMHDGPIPNDTILVFDALDGTLKQSWGSNLFYLPHGLTVDFEGFVWLTDVALHQVFKFTPDGKTIILTLGTKFVPGNDLKHFCKPTSVAVMANGDFFVADGYCNSRIIKYSSDGKMILLWGTKNFGGMLGVYRNHYSLEIPHGLAILEDFQEVCVADRENGRIVCYDYYNGTYTWAFSHSSIGSRLFSVAYAPVCGGQLYVVNGPVTNKNVSGFVINKRTNNIVSQFGASLKNPHDIAVSKNGSQVFVVELEPFIIHKYATKFTHNQTEKLQINDEELQNYLLDKWVIASAVLLVVFIIFIVYIAMKIIKKQRETTKDWIKPAMMDTMFRLNKLKDKQNIGHGFQRLKVNESDEDIGATIDI